MSKYLIILKVEARNLPDAVATATEIVYAHPVVDRNFVVHSAASPLTERVEIVTERAEIVHQASLPSSKTRKRKEEESTGQNRIGSDGNEQDRTEPERIGS